MESILFTGKCYHTSERFPKSRCWVQHRQRPNEFQQCAFSWNTRVELFCIIDSWSPFWTTFLEFNHQLKTSSTQRSASIITWRLSTRRFWTMIRWTSRISGLASSESHSHSSWTMLKSTTFSKLWRWLRRKRGSFCRSTKSTRKVANGVIILIH